MRLFTQYRSLFVILFLLLISVIFFTKCVTNEKNKPNSYVEDNGYKKFAGSGKCIACHKNIYDTHIYTAHFLTSGIATEKNIKGSFDVGKNTYEYNNGSIIAMEKRENGFYQVAYINGQEKKSQRFDIFFGSGTKGQSYASWQKNKLLQMPVTYFTSADQWSNSPGYPNKIAFNRPITSRCLECHSTFIQKISEEKKEPEDFDRNQVILGVDCERCHGPAAKHVEFQTQNPKETKGQFIIDPARLSRQQSLDMCALCHGGRLQKTKPSFEFITGDKLSDYFLIDTAAKDANNIDVHGNQSGLLGASKCFKNSKTLTCITCHNTHENEKGKNELFAQRCMSCHNNEHKNVVQCTMTSFLGSSIKANCIDCHMPELPSMAIAVLLQGATSPTPAKMRSHFIKVYPDETKKVLDFIKKQKK